MSSSSALARSGIFAVFELGLLDIRCHLIDILPKVGGQCAELYPEKPIYDIPGYPSVTGQGLVDQADGADRAVPADLPPRRDGRGDRDAGCTPEAPSFCVRTDFGKDHRPARRSWSRRAAARSSRRSRRSPASRPTRALSVHYAVRRMEDFRDARLVVIVGGGDSALDWTLNLQPIASRLHADPPPRRLSRRAALGQRDARAGRR